MKRSNISWNDGWIYENAGNYHMTVDLYKAYVNEVDSTISYQAFRTHIKRKLKLGSNSTWSENERKWVAENYPKLGGLKCVEPFEKKFGKHRTATSIMAEARRQGLLVEEDVVVSNKNYTRRVPIGTIVDDGDGYLKIKTGNGSSGWERYHRYLYKKRYGAIPKGHKIIFLDGNRRNYDTDNMVAIPGSYLAIMNKLKLKSQEPEITKTSIKWCELYEILKKNYVVES